MLRTTFLKLYISEMHTLTDANAGHRTAMRVRLAVSISLLVDYAHTVELIKKNCHCNEYDLAGPDVRQFSQIGVDAVLASRYAPPIQV